MLLGRPMVSWQASSASFSRRSVSLKLYVYHPLLLFSVLIVFAETRNRAFPEDRCKAWRQRFCLRQIFIPFFRHVASYRGCFFTPAVSYSIPASLVFSKSSRYGAIFPSSSPFTYSYMLHVSVAFRIWLLGRFKG